MFEEIALTGLNKRDYVTAKELWLIQKYAMDACIMAYDKNEKDWQPGIEEYITDEDLEIII